MGNHVSPEALEKIRADLARWRPGLWTEEGLESGRIDLGPQCLCGVGERTLAAARALSSTHGEPTGKCQRHPEGRDEKPADQHAPGQPGTMPRAVRLPAA